MDLAPQLLAIAAIIAANAFFVVAEYALVTARRSALQDRGPRADRALRLMEDPVRVISTVQIGITALSILLGAIGEPVVRDLLGGALPSWTSFALAFVLVTYLSVAFGELVPKALALHAAETVAIIVARPIDVLAKLFGPAVWVLQASARIVLTPLGVPAVGAGDRPVSRDELRAVLQEAERHGTLGAEEEGMLSGVIDLRLRQAADVMRPWEDVDVVCLDDPPETALDAMLGAAHSRCPAVRGDGKVVGVLHARDAWAAWRTAGPESGLDLRPLVREAVIVPPSVRVDALLRRLRRERQQMAIVVDEYGRPAGIVTIEDVLEEIVGEIEDEFDVLDERFERVSANEWVVDGAVSISDFNRRTGAHVDRGRARSIGGVLLAQLGRVPSAGDRVEMNGLAFVVEAVAGNRIESVRACLAAESGEAVESDAGGPPIGCGGYDDATGDRA